MKDCSPILSAADGERFASSNTLGRRAFLHRCGTLVAGSLCATMLTSADQRIWAADASAQSSRLMTPGDRVLLNLLSAYSADAYFWGGQVFARATGQRTTEGTTHLLVRVGDYSQLVGFLRSDAMKKFSRIVASNNTLSFTYQGAAYTVTNASAEDFSRAVAGGGVARDHLTGVGVFAHQTVLYHPATDTLRDPHLAVESKRLDLAELPTGGTKERVQTLLQGWLEAGRQNMSFGTSFESFQRQLLNSQPTTRSASEVVLTLLDNLPELAGVYDLDQVGSLLSTPLIDASLQTVLGLQASQVTTQMKTLRAEPTLASYPDAALWLATLLPAQIEDGTVDQWLTPPGIDAAAAATNRAALSMAKQLVRTLATRQ